MSPDYFVTHVPGYFDARLADFWLATRDSRLAARDYRLVISDYRLVISD